MNYAQSGRHNFSLPPFHFSLLLTLPPPFFLFFRGGGDARGRRKFISFSPPLLRFPFLLFVPLFSPPRHRRRRLCKLPAIEEDGGGGIPLFRPFFFTHHEKGGKGETGSARKPTLVVVEKGFFLPSSPSPLSLLLFLSGRFTF